MSEKRQIISCIEKEIEWCLNDKSSDIPYAEKTKFIEGLRQAIYLAEHCVPEKSELPSIAKLCKQRDSLRSDLQRVTAERDALKKAASDVMAWWNDPLHSDAGKAINKLQDALAAVKPETINSKEEKRINSQDQSLNII
jgi:hypothetical protein